MAKKPPKPPGKNAACPCGSGKKYKRCCWPGEGAAAAGEMEAVEPSMQEFEKALQASGELLDALGWQTFDFRVDLWDPVIGDLTQLVGDAEDGEVSDEDLFLRECLGVLRHATLDVRARLLDELERRVPERPTGRLGKIARAVAIALEDAKIEPVRIDLIPRLYHRYILDRVLSLQAALKAEAKGHDPDFLQLAERIAEQREPADIQRLADLLRPLGPAALQYVEFAVGLDVDEVYAPLVDLVAAHPSLRAARLLEAMLFESVTPAFDDLLFATFSRMPDHSWPLLLYRVEDPDTHDWQRLAAYEMLVRARRWQVFVPLMHEFDARNERTHPMDDSALPDLAKKLAELGDRRAVGHAVQMIRDREIRPTAVDALRGAWTANGWWQEVEDALAALRRNELVLVGAGEDMDLHIREQLEGSPPATLEGANFRLDLLRTDWNKAYHEDLGWLRPIDVFDPGPRERTLMHGFVEFAKPRMTSTTPDPDAARRTNELQSEWMSTPCADLHGKCPMVVIWEERRARSKNPAHLHAYETEKLNDLYGAARIAFDADDTVAAKAQLDLMLQLDATHPFARRLRGKM